MANKTKKQQSKGEIIIYQNDVGDIQLDVFLRDDTVWLTQDHMSQLFDKAKSTINEHIQNIYRENELDKIRTMKKFGNSEFSKKFTDTLIPNICDTGQCIFHVPSSYTSHHHSTVSSQDSFYHGFTRGTLPQLRWDRIEGR